MCCLKGDGLGKLWKNGKEAFYGSCPNTSRRVGFIKHGYWLVQVIPDLINGWSINSSAPSSSFTTFVRKHCGTMLREILIVKKMTSWLAFFNNPLTRLRLDLWPQTSCMFDQFLLEAESNQTTFREEKVRFPFVYESNLGRPRSTIVQLPLFSHLMSCIFPNPKKWELLKVAVSFIVEKGIFITFYQELFKHS